jgi:hypothetical protein
MANFEYTQWYADTTAEESKAAKKVTYLANYLKTCYNVDTTVHNPDADIRTTPMNQWYIEAVDQNADQLDTLYRELESMVTDIQRMMEAVAELSDIRRELATTTEEDFED